MADTEPAKPTGRQRELEILPTLTHYAARIIATEDSDLKALYTDEVSRRWKNGEVKEIGSAPAPATPGRPEHVKLLPPGLAPKRGKAGSLKSRIAILHSLTHIESVAIDLSWDILCRFSADYPNLPSDFFDDWIKVAKDEAKHFRMLKLRLKELGSNYGELPVHDGLWNDAMRTSEDILSRLAIEHMVHEARGLDITPQTISRFEAAGDRVSADLLQVILKDEITHVTAGVKWFTFVTSLRWPGESPVEKFIQMVPKYFHGSLKPPFNTEARNTAGMTSDWYLPLVSTNSSQQGKPAVQTTAGK